MKCLYLLASLFLIFATASSVADHSSSRQQFEALASFEQVEPSMDCAGGSAHGFCHWNLPVSEMATFTSSKDGQASFAIDPMRATGRAYAPNPPPPRPLI
jgi:hypothetical protein